MRAGQVELAAKLRSAGYAVDVLLEPAKKVAKAFSYADRVNGRRVLFVAPDEWAKGEVRMKELRAICGGGRYDKLLSLYGSPEVVPACGFGFGDCVVVELLKERNLTPKLAPMIDFVVAPYNAELRAAAAKVAASLRAAGFSVDVLLATIVTRHPTIEATTSGPRRMNGLLVQT